MGDSGLFVYLVGIALVWVPYALVRRRRDRRNREALAASHRAGLTEPASLHPLIDRNECLGCGNCVPACPEGDVLGLIAGKAELINPANCIGHGACKEACPQDAISLVLGSETRSVEIPVVHPNFETNAPGIFVAGEVGGMGLIRNAIEQGRQAIGFIRDSLGDVDGDELDVLVVGAGPAGFAASLGAKELGLRSETLEQETLGGTVSHYPRGKIVMTRPAELPLVGKVRLSETSKESLLEFWESVEQKTGVRIRYGERVESIERTADGFEVTSTRGTYRTRSVLLAIGRRGTPRKLGVAGEEQTKVVYRLIDPAQYRGESVLVVGGGDSALEAALAIADEPGTQVGLSYRGAAFSRAKPANRERLEVAEQAGRLRVMLESNVRRIGTSDVEIATTAGVEQLANDHVIVCAGGVLPTEFLQKLGVKMETKRGTA